MKTVILLSGKKSTGKDTSFELIRDMFSCNEPYCRCKTVIDTGTTHCYPLGYRKHVKKISFADPLKSLCQSAFGLTTKQCYGESGERETPSEIRWGDLCSAYSDRPKDELLTAREILQLVGTNVMRSFFPNIWAKAATIAAFKSPADISVFTDARFPNEIEEFEKLASGNKIKLVVIRLIRDTGLFDEHESETALDEWDSGGRFEHNLINNGSMQELKDMLRHILEVEGLLEMDTKCFQQK